MGGPGLTWRHLKDFGCAVAASETAVPRTRLCQRCPRRQPRPVVWLRPGKMSIPWLLGGIPGGGREWKSSKSSESCFLVVEVDLKHGFAPKKRRVQS